MTNKKTYNGKGRKKIRAKSEKQEAADAEIRALKKATFERWGDGQFMPCQVCGHEVHIDVADAMHKKPRGRGRDDGPLNLIIGHGFRWKPNNCHYWADGKASRIETMIASKANVLNGDQVKWSSEQTATQRLFLKSGYQSLKGA